MLPNAYCLMTKETAGQAAGGPEPPLDSLLFQLAGDTSEDRAEAGLDRRHGDGKCETGCGSDQAVLDRGHAVLVLEEVNNPAHAKLLRWLLAALGLAPVIVNLAVRITISFAN